MRRARRACLEKGLAFDVSRLLKEEERYKKCFSNGYYLTGDLAKFDEDGYFWFVGRTDDIIKSSGHLIGPFEVESVLDGTPCRRRSSGHRKT